MNLKDKSIQVLVKSTCYSGFCIQTGNRSFDFHFTSEAKEEDKKEYTYHHRLPLFEDAIAAMEEGQLTFAPQQPIEVAKEKSRMVKEKKEALDLI